MIIIRFTLIHTYRCDNKRHRILFLRFFQKYTICLGSRGHLYNHLQSNGGHLANRKEILNKRCGTDLVIVDQLGEF